MPKVIVKVPKRSGFDKSHQNILTGQVGDLVPILVDELIPNTKVYLKDVITASLPPLASDTFMRVNLKVEAFFVPSRLCYGGFEQWITAESRKDAVKNQSYYAYTPTLRVNQGDLSTYCNPGSLLDYLGIRSVAMSTGQGNDFNIYPVLAYHRIWNDWYRNTQIQNPCFQEMSEVQETTNGQIPVYCLPYNTIAINSLSNYSYRPGAKLADGADLGSLRQRNFGYDYFTGAFPSAQQGSAQQVSFSTSGATGNFTIASLRAANSLQQFAERNQMAGYRLQDWVSANYGANLSTGVAQRAILLGSAEIPVYSKGIYQTANNDAYSGATYNNPFNNSAGAEVGSAQCSGQIELIKDFTAQEPGYLMVLASLVPKVTYSSGIDRMMLRYNAQNSQPDMANPLLQNVGNQAIMTDELTGSYVNSPSVFGWTERFADFKVKMDTLHGLVRDGQSLESFALQRTITGTPQISDTFLKIPNTYLDQVSATNVAISNYGFWLDAFHDYKVSMPLASYSIPSLQDPAYEHGNDVAVEIGGSKL